jgi:hypothetical protein
MAAVSVGICTFLRSGVSAGNDLGWRGFLPAQFMMLLWGADLLVRRGERAEKAGQSFSGWWMRSPVWAPLIVLGIAGTLYEVVLLRTYFLWNDAGVTSWAFFAPDRHFGTRALELRRAYERLDRILPAGAKVQSSPEWRYFDFYNGLYSNRQTVVGDKDCGAVFGGDMTSCAGAFAGVSAIFDGGPKTTWEEVERTCHRLSIDALVVTDLDDAWRGDDWMRETTPEVSGQHVRVYLIKN